MFMFQAMATRYGAGPPGLCEESLLGKFCKLRKCRFEHLGRGVSVYDSHCHLDILQDRFGTRTSDLHLPQQYRGCMAVFCHPERYRLASGILQDPCVWGAVGLHPKCAGSISHSLLQTIESMVDHPRVLAVGETGLDYSAETNPSATCQKYVFAAHCRLAQQRQLPIVVHCRDAEDDCLAVMAEHLPGSHSVHLHCFTGGWDRAQQFLERFPNLSIGVTGLVTKSSPVRELAEHVPLDRLLLETDAPYLMPTSAPTDCHFTHPGMILHQAKAVADIRHVPVAEVCNQTSVNFVRVYGVGV